MQRSPASTLTTRCGSPPPLASSPYFAKLLLLLPGIQICREREDRYIKAAAVEGNEVRQHSSIQDCLAGGVRRRPAQATGTWQDQSRVVKEWEHASDRPAMDGDVAPRLSVSDLGKADTRGILRVPSETRAPQTCEVHMAKAAKQILLLLRLEVCPTESAK
nr:hypothetical protein Iba_chr06eCG3630 [Ipomoea batatas]